MNNCIWCHCLECGNEFSIPVPDLLEAESDTIVGRMVWCGVCDSHSYECSWGMFAAGSSPDTVAHVLRSWNDWANGYRTSRVDFPSALQVRAGGSHD